MTRFLTALGRTWDAFCIAALVMVCYAIDAVFDLFDHEGKI